MTESASDKTPPTFDAIPLSPDVRRAVDAMGYTHPTPVQMAVFELATRGKNLVVQARTGTGKTAAFGLPLVDRLVRRSVNAAQALVLCPTRELAIQVAGEIERLAQFRSVKVAPIYGGASMGKQVEALQAGTQVVIGTPGRVLDHIRRGTLDPSGIRVLVLDEADEMLSMGFAKELNAICETLPKDRQGLFFSATIPPDIERLAQSHLKDPEFVTLSSDQVGALEIAHFVYMIRHGDKRGELARILEVEDPESAIIFCNTKDETERLAEHLKNKGYDADWLNGDLEQRERERIMARTREGKLRFLVATDVAARGIDISHLTHVINFDFPESAEPYVHRTGRTGRAGKTGTAISLIEPKDIGNLYLLRLTYKIRPIERQLPTHGELKTRAEQDMVDIFVEAFAKRAVHPDDLAIARRLLTHPSAEQIVAGLLRDHLGARQTTDVQQDAAEARRARNPPPVREAREEPPPRAPRRERERERDQDRDRDRRRTRERGPGPDLPAYTVSDTQPDAAPVPAASAREAERAAAGEPEEPGFCRIFVNVGRKDGVRPGDLQKVCVAGGLAKEDVGRIRLRDKVSFVSVRRESFDRAVAALTASDLGGGRPVTAELARGENPE
jgi:ATP-dependent RNA helicase DeaD